MDRIRKLMHVFALIALMGLALPSVAADKQYIAQVLTQGTLSAVKVWNDKDGVSNINSLWIRVKAPATLTSPVSLDVFAPNGKFVANYPASFRSSDGTYAEFISIAGYKPGGYALIKSVNNIECFSLGVFTGNTLGGTQFTLNATGNSTQGSSDLRYGCDAFLACGASTTIQSGQNTTIITRSQEDKLGGCTTGVALKVIFSDSDNRVEIKWENPNVFLKVDTTWPYSLANPTTTLPYLTRTSWESDSSGNPINIIPAPACRTDDLPPYSATNPNPEPAGDSQYPFPIIAAGALLPDGTPHPYAGNGTPVRVCLVSETYTVQPFATAACPIPTTSVGCYLKRSIAYMNNDPMLIGR